MLDYLVKWNSAHGRLPTVPQMAFDMKCERSVIAKRLTSLVEQGKVQRLAWPITHKLPGS